jgi:hypothetical protein
MSELFPRDDLINPYEEIVRSTQAPFPVFGTENIVPGVNEGIPQTNIRFIYGIDDVVDQHALVEQIGNSDVIVYCSDWGSGLPDVPGQAEEIQEDVRYFQDPDHDAGDIEPPEKIHPVLSTLMFDLNGANKSFYIAGNFESDEVINEMDIERDQTYGALVASIAGFEPVDETIKRLDEFTSKAAVYNCAVEQRAYEQIADILTENSGSQVAVIASNSFLLLPRYFRGDEATPPVTMTSYHMPWARLVRGAVKADNVAQEYMLEGKNEYLNKPGEWEPAHRPLIDQIVFMKQIGQQPPTHLFYGTIYSIIASKIVGRGDMYGPDVEYRLIDNPEHAKPMLTFFETMCWARLREYFSQSDEAKKSNPAFGDFLEGWLEMSI